MLKPHKRATRMMVVACVIALPFTIAACGSDDDGGSGTGGGASGSIATDGSSTVFPITQAVAEEFQNENDDVKVSVGSSGTGGGFEKFCAGETDISNASRAIDADEEAICEKAGIEFVELQVGVDGLSVLVNPENDFADCLTVAELKKIWGPGSKVSNWKDVNPEFPDQELTLYGPGTDSGTFDYFTDVINGEEGASRSDYTASEDDNILVKGVQGDPNALAYFGFGYYEQNKDTLKLVEVDGGKGCTTPSSDTINSGEYAPLSRPIFIYVSKEAAGKDVTREFVDFYLDNMNDLVTEVGYVPVKADQLDKDRTTWSDFQAR